MIALESVSKRYGSKTIIHDLSFTVGKGEIVGFLGPNGAGKTTTMRMIAGYTTATSGRVTVAGFDMATQNEDAARKLGYLPEQPPLYDVLDVSAYLRFVAKAKGVPSREIPSELDRVISACRLGERRTARDLQAIEGLPPASRPGPGAARQTGSAAARRADRRPRPGTDPGSARGDPRIRREPRGTAEHPHPSGGDADLPARGDHQSRAAARDRFARAACRKPRNKPTACVWKSLRRQSRCATPCLLSTVYAAPSCTQCRAAMRYKPSNVRWMRQEGIEARIARAVASRWDLHRLERQQPTLENIFLRYVGDTTQEKAA